MCGCHGAFCGNREDWLTNNVNCTTIMMVAVGKSIETE